MIYTKEPANTYYVYLTAYRSCYTPSLNEVLVDGMAERIRGLRKLYGKILDEGVVGCYTEAGNTEATVERTLQVHCTGWNQVMMLAELAHVRYDQDSILAVASQTHTASLISVRSIGEYPQECETLDIVPLGVFTQQDTGAENYSIIDGQRWEVA